jgi:hypothetical protein
MKLASLVLVALLGGIASADEPAPIDPYGPFDDIGDRVAPFDDGDDRAAPFDDRVSPPVDPFAEPSDSFARPPSARPSGPPVDPFERSPSARPSGPPVDPFARPPGSRSDPFARPPSARPPGPPIDPFAQPQHPQRPRLQQHRQRLRRLLLHHFDRNGDGQLQPQERRQAAKVLRRLAGKLHRANAQNQRKQRFIRRFDLNRDGNVGPGEMPPALADELRPLDRDGNGWLENGELP